MLNSIAYEEFVNFDTFAPLGQNYSCKFNLLEICYREQINHAKFNDAILK